MFRSVRQRLNGSSLLSDDPDQLVPKARCILGRILDGNDPDLDLVARSGSWVEADDLVAEELPSGIGRAAHLETQLGTDAFALDALRTYVEHFAVSITQAGSIWSPSPREVVSHPQQSTANGSQLGSHHSRKDRFRSRQRPARRHGSLTGGV